MALEQLDRLRSNGINLIIAAGDAAFPLLTSVKHLGPAIGPRMIVLAADNPVENDYYRLIPFEIPKDIMLEAGGIELLPDGKLAISTRRGG